VIDLPDLTPNRAYLLHEVWNFESLMLSDVIENEHAKESKLRIMGFRIPSRYFDQAAVTIGDDIVWSVWEGLIEAWVNATPGPGDREDRPQTTLTAHEVAIILDPRQSWNNLARRFIVEITDSGIAAWELVEALSHRKCRQLGSAWKKAARKSSRPSEQDPGQFLRF
jgi:hypothetical protein